jgi:chromosome segregation ATPase
MRATLLIGGASFEFLGIILIAFPDISPYLRQFSRRLLTLTRALLDRIHRLLGRPKDLRIEVHSAAELNLAGGVSLMKSASGTATLEEKVEFLLKRDQEAQRDVNALRERIEDFERESPKRLDESRREIETRFERELKAAPEEYRLLRILGVIALVVGLGCATYANFIN